MSWNVLRIPGTNDKGEGGFNKRSPLINGISLELIIWRARHQHLFEWFERLPSNFFNIESSWALTLVVVAP